MTDWNNDGKTDWKDAYIFNEIIDKPESNNTYRSSSGSSGGSFFAVVVCICVGIIFLALLLGVEVPGVVVTFFLKIILFAGFIALFMKK